MGAPRLRAASSRLLGGPYLCPALRAAVWPEEVPRVLEDPEQPRGGEDWDLFSRLDAAVRRADTRLRELLCLPLSHHRPPLCRLSISAGAEITLGAGGKEDLH